MLMLETFHVFNSSVEMFLYNVSDERVTLGVLKVRIDLSI